MPRFYVDTTDQTELVIDQIGGDFDDVDAALKAAIVALPNMAQDTLPDGDSRIFVASVRDAQGRTLVAASLAFNVIWLTSPPVSGVDAEARTSAND